MPRRSTAARPGSPPRYLAVLGALRADVAAAPPNTILPTEQQLARRFEVSRLTLRRALGLLERSGLVSRQRGRGTVVSPPKVSRLLAPLYTLEEDFRQQGIKLETRVLGFARGQVAPAHIRERLGLHRRSRVAVLSLLRLVDGRTIACDQAYLPMALAARLEPEELATRPLLEALRDRTRVPIGRLDWEIEIVPSSPEAAAALGLTPGVLVVASSTTAFAEDGSAVSRSERYYRIDRVKFHFATRYAPDAAPAESPRPTPRSPRLARSSRPGPHPTANRRSTVR
jgi:GntR family transcriptional regulator